jgi:hypothetical protein
MTSTSYSAMGGSANSILPGPVYLPDTARRSTSV